MKGTKMVWINPAPAGLGPMRAAFYLFFAFFLNVLLYTNSYGSFLWIERLMAEGALGLRRMIMSTVFLLVVFVLLCTLLKRTMMSAALMTVPFYIMSLVDSSKIETLGTRLAIDDLLMVFNMGELWSFKGGQSGIIFKPVWLLTFALAILLVCAVGLFDSGFWLRLPYRRTICAALSVFCALSLSVKGFAVRMFGPQIEGYEAAAVAVSGEGAALSTIDCLIGSLYIHDAPPYMLGTYDEEHVAPLLDPYPVKEGTGVRPDVVVIMSESYFDMNKINDIMLNEDIYASLRAIQRDGVEGQIAVPAFGGGTAATECEVLTGASNRSLRNVRAPYRTAIGKEHIPSFVDDFNDMGYHTVYMHPYKGYFYGRQQVMAAMGFDELIFEEGFAQYEGTYERDIHISDMAMTTEIINKLESADEPLFLYATSMQNHAPYVKMSENDRDIASLPQDAPVTDDEREAINAYANGVADTDVALSALFNYIKSRGRPTVLLFFGDHQPLLDGYKIQNGITNDSIYESISNITTPFALYANYEPPRREEGSPTVISAFYLLPYLMEYAGLDESRYAAFLNESRKKLPIYCNRLIRMGPGDSSVTGVRRLIDTLSYDRWAGEEYSVLKAAS